jgi:hypothetical protein
MVFEYPLRCQAKFATCQSVETAGNNITFCEVCRAAYCSTECKDWDSWTHLGSTDCKPTQVKKRMRLDSSNKDNGTEEMDT